MISDERLAEVANNGDPWLDEAQEMAKELLAHRKATIPDEFLNATQNERGMFEISEDCMCQLLNMLCIPPPFILWHPLIYCLHKQYIGEYMRKLVSAGTAFYMLDKGEKLTKNELYHIYHPVRFVIWPRGDKWDVLERVGNEWLRLTDQLFDSENEAFVFAYEKFCDDQDRERMK